MIKKLDYIERNNGYLDINSYLLEKYNTLNKNKLLNLGVIIQAKAACFIKIDGVFYRFKCCLEKESVKELLACKMLNYVGYDYVEYDMVSVFGEYGVICQSYKKEGYDYISGDILIETYHDLIDIAEDDKDEFFIYKDIDDYNNLENIWDILEIKYKFYPNKDEIVNRIMKKIIQKFMFDIITFQDDGASYNWEIEENNDIVDLVPIYDNSKMLDGFNSNLPCILNMKVENDDIPRVEYSNVVELKKFLNYSSEEFIKEFIYLFEHLTYENIKYMLMEIEKETGFKIKPTIIKEILNKYIFNYNQLQKVLDKELSQKR